MEKRLLHRMSWHGRLARESRARCTCHSLVVFLAAGLLFVAGAGSASAQVGVPADPSMKLQGLDGKVLDIADQRGNVVLVSFGATWCVPCTTELKALEELLVEYRGQPVKFFWVSIERPEEVTNNALKRYAKERKVSFPVLRDTAKMVFLQFSPRVRLPMIVSLGKDGKVDGTAQFGMRSPADAYKADLRARLNKLLRTSASADR
jgi:peroxiredoxin